LTRESVAVKARRYLVEARLNVRHVAADSITAVCRGDGGEVYQTGYERGGWYCDCLARGRCCHMQALMLVVVRPRKGDEG
jgi:hypothetical protein